MPPAIATEFMINLHKQLIDTKKVAETTASKYLQNLVSLNGGQPFKNLSWLKNNEHIDAHLESLAPATRLANYACITSVLSLFKDKPTYKKTFTHYSDKMNAGATERNAKDPHAKSDKQEENWVSWEAVNKTKADLAKKVAEFHGARAITAGNFDDLLSYVLLSLYTEVQPRRNQDYMEMYVVGKYEDTLPADKNYLSLSDHKFIFNKYKTAKKYGKQIEDIPEPLFAVITEYLVRHPNYKKKMPKAYMYKFLVKHDGSPLNSANGITRILNKVFAKKVGSSMLRNIYLSDKYGDTLSTMADDAAAMGHSVEQQKAYVKND
jgi:hypothetical protein